MSARASYEEMNTMIPSPASAFGPVSRQARVASTGLALACSFLACLTLIAMPASAEEAHELVRTIHGTELPQGAFGEIVGVAVDNSSDLSKGDIYVYETNPSTFPKVGMIDKLDGEGKYLGVQVTGSETPQGSLLPAFNPTSGRSSGIAVDDSTSPNRGDVYVGDIEHGIVDRFSESGAFLCQITAKPPATRSNAEEKAECDGATGSGTPQESLEPTGIAVDSSGDVYVSDRKHKVIDEFSPLGAYLGQISDPSIEKASALAIAPDGDIYMLNWTENVVQFSAAGTFLSSFDELEAASANARPTAMTVDPTNGHVYVVDEEPTPRSTLQEYGEADGLLGTLGSEQLSNNKYAFGLAVNRSTGDLFAAERLEEPGAAIYAFSPDLPPGPPKVESESSWNTSFNSSEVRAEIDPSDLAATCRVQYVDDEQFRTSGYDNATTVGCQPESFDASFTIAKAKAQLTSLFRDTTYHYRFIVANSAAPQGVVGSDETLSTFGIQSFSVGAFGPVGEVDVLAGSHPYELTTTFAFPTTNVSGKAAGAEANPRDIEVGLPPGLVGNPDAVAKCDPYDVAHADCSGASQVGVLNVTTTSAEYESPIYNLVPPAGVAAQFGARLNGIVTAYIDAQVRSGSDYGVTAASLNVATDEGLTGVTVAFWGVPSDPRHDGRRFCPATGKDNEEYPCSVRGPLVPFLRNPTSCSGPRATSLRVDTWQESGTFAGASGEMPAVTECGKPKFEPGLEVQPTSTLVDSPSGLDVDVHMPQPEGCTETVGKVECELAEADLRNTTVTLPAGIAINPSSADGLEGCSEEQVGYLPKKSAEVGHPQFTPGAAECPDASKVGEVEVVTPLVGHPLPGAVYVAEQDANPFKSLLALYITVFDPRTGVVIKLPAKVTLDPLTGQVTTTVSEAPQLPFNDFKLDFFSESRATLTTPFVCGSYAASSVLTPWSAPEGKDAEPSSLPFTVSSAPGGAGCVNSEAQAPNVPVFEAGTASPIAGSYSPFVLRLKREDASQHFSALNVTLPPGLSGKIAGVAQCSQAAIEAAQARTHEGEGAVELAQPSCPAASEIGVVHVGAGSGAPYYVTGHAYFAGPYKGAPFSLVFVTPAVAGPFDLGTVVVRAALFIDPTTAQVTVKSDPFPSILDGIPLDIRDVDVDMNRGEFTLNPTSCSVMGVTGEELSTAGQAAGLSDRFQAGGCTTLPFDPTFGASTRGNGRIRGNGASLSVKISTKEGPGNKAGEGEANIEKVDVSLPHALSTRLSTLKLACTEKQFASNPADCPAGSRVGTAVAHTPLLASPLVGPAILVSHGGEEFPNLVLLLQGEGVTIEQVGDTLIKHGITYSKFESVPDAPIDSFELTLPEGPDSVLGAIENLCKPTKTVSVSKKVKRRVHGKTVTVTEKVSKQVAEALVMPTSITAQNGAQVTQNTPIAVTGCPKVVKSKPKTVKKPKKSKSKSKTGKGKRGK
ncbi:MAG TPA: NHL repeat-containing protein [Solirubrobacteraceae bacterium]|jgi:hypothetical protein|nr:NHL repeat-containing protein [Solirubrobacteraceae bacterium]